MFQKMIPFKTLIWLIIFCNFNFVFL